MAVGQRAVPAIGSLPEAEESPEPYAVSLAAKTISFVVTTENGVRHAGAVLAVIAGARREGDEVILLTRADRVSEFRGAAEPWLRLVGIPDANVFTLRGHVPAVARRDWIVLLEEHSLVTAGTLAAIRSIIDTRPELDLIAFLGRNLTELSPWAWANFLHTFALIWAPLDHAPAFSPVTAVTVRRAALDRETPMPDGEWELRTIPTLFARGRVGYSNEIYIDHVKPVNFAACFALNFHNARAGAANQRALGVSRRAVVREGWRTLTRRPRRLARAVRARRHELPRGIFWRLRVVGLAFYLGAVMGAHFGAGDSAHRLD